MTPQFGRLGGKAGLLLIAVGLLVIGVAYNAVASQTVLLAQVPYVVSGGLTPERIRFFKESGAPVDSFAVGSYISGASPIDFTGDIKEIDGRPIAKRGRIPGRTESPRLRRVNLGEYREVPVG